MTTARPRVASVELSREWRRMAKQFAPLWLAALDQRTPSPELLAAIRQIEGDSMLRFFLEEACES